MRRCASRGSRLARAAARAGRPASALIAAAAVALAAGCKPYVIEYHSRPAFYHTASDRPLPDELEKPDGTRIIYRDARSARGGQGAGGRKGDSEPPPFQIRETGSDGSIVLRCVLPEHVIANAMTCIRQREYEILWDQLLSRAAREAYVREADGFDGFADFIEDERGPIMETLNRMSFGFHGQDVILETGARGSLQARLGPRLIDQFRYTVVEIVMEDGLLRLHTIR
ncbi:MAG TPA: hypothetical protein PKC43_09360 [Phycisphaerales bacterium]|nr:hypothetical protein [Phycisphaerales bacterium]HMP37642.1 hypothetical protein [Phycisphaerales bacterium]